MLARAQKLIAIGPTPPPVHGVSYMTEHVLNAIGAAGLLAAHLDTRDARPVATTGRLDLRNLALALGHLIRLLVLLLRHRDAAVYLPLSQLKWGFLRDAAMIALASLFGRPVVAHVHGGSFAGFYRVSGPVVRWIARATLRRIGEIWVLTPVHRQMFSGLVPDERIRVLENASEDLIGDGEAGSNDGVGSRRFLFLSNLLPEKGLFDLLDALERVEPVGGGIEVRLAGEAEDRVLVELRRRAELLAARGVAVRWDGVLVGPEKLAAFAWAQAFVLPSRYPEGQPISLLEAMSAGLAVIGTDRGRPTAGTAAADRPTLSADPSGIPFTARPDREALIVPPGDPEALAGAIGALVADPELTARLAGAARSRYLDRYRPERFRAAVAELLLEGRSQR